MVPLKEEVLRVIGGKLGQPKPRERKDKEKSGKTKERKLVSRQ